MILRVTSLTDFKIILMILLIILRKQSSIKIFVYDGMGFTPLGIYPSICRKVILLMIIA